MGIGKNIRNMLDIKKMTVKELSDSTLIPYGTIHSIIKRDSEKVKTETLQRIAEALKVSIESLMWDEEKALKSFEYLNILKKAKTNRVETFASMMNITYDRCLALLSEEEAPTEQEQEKLRLITGLSFEEFLAPAEIDNDIPIDVDDLPWSNPIKEYQESKTAFLENVEKLPLDRRSQLMAALKLSTEHAPRDNVKREKEYIERLAHIIRIYGEMSQHLHVMALKSTKESPDEYIRLLQNYEKLQDLIKEHKDDIINGALEWLEDDSKLKALIYGDDYNA